MNKIINSITLTIGVLCLMVFTSLHAQEIHNGSDLFYFNPTPNYAVTNSQPALRADGVQKEIAVGYCSDNAWGNGLCYQYDGECQVMGAIKLSKELLIKYKDCSIKSVMYYANQADRKGYKISVFVLDNLDGQGQPLSTYSRRSYDDGWNTIPLKSPVKITGDKDLYVGYSISYRAMEDGDNWPNGVTFDNNQDLPYVPKTSFYSVGGDWWSADIDIKHNLMIRAVVTGSPDQLPQGDVSVHNLSPEFTIFEQNSSINYSFGVRNNCSDVVNSITYELVSNGKTLSEETVTDLDIESGKDKAITVYGATLNEQGNEVVTVNVTKVNGADDPNVSDNMSEVNVYLIAKGRKLVSSKKVLLEQVCNECNPSTPKMDRLLQRSVNDYNGVKVADSSQQNLKDSKVVWVRHHYNDDVYIEQDKVLLEQYLFGQNPNPMWENGNKPFVPSISVDRTDFQTDPEHEFGVAHLISNSDYVLNMFKICSSIPCTASIDIENKYDPKTRKIVTTISGETSADELLRQFDPRLVVMAVEDSVVSSNQVKAWKGGDYNDPDYHKVTEMYDKYTHNGVVRHYLTEPMGSELRLFNYSYKNTYEYEVPADFNPNNMRIVAFLYDFRGSRMKVREGKVYNVNQLTFTAEKGTDIQKVVAIAPKVYVDGGTIMVSSNGTIDRIYDLSGRIVSNGQLSSGYYLVRVMCDGTHSMVKVVVP